MKLKYGPYSPSRLDTAACAYNFYNTYIIKPRPEKTEDLPQARGSAVHEINEKITARLKENLLVSDADLRTWTKEAVLAHPAAEQELEAIMEMGQLYLRRPPANLTPNSQIELKLAVKMLLDENGAPVTYTDLINGAEVVRHEFEQCDYDDPQAFARGRADILTISDDTTKAYIIDHKTQPNIEDAETFQMGFYAWVILKIYPFLEEVHTTLNFSRYGTYSEPFVWTREDLYRIENQLLTRVDIIESRENWEIATANKNCQYCPFITKCPAMKEFIEVDPESGAYTVKMNNFKILNDHRKALSLLSLYHVLGEAYTSIEREIKPFILANGALAISGVVYEFKGTEKINWNIVNKPAMREKIYEIYAKHNIDPKSFMGFSETFSKSIWLTENPMLIKELAELFPRKVETRFSGSKI